MRLAKAGKEGRIKARVVVNDEYVSQRRMNRWRLVMS
jgi:hypothetical protein